MYVRSSGKPILKQFHEDADHQGQADDQEDLGSMRDGFQAGMHKNQQGQQGKVEDVPEIPRGFVGTRGVIVRAAEEEQNRQQDECSD